MTVTLIDHNRGNEREFDTLAEAQDTKEQLKSVGADEDDLEIVEDTGVDADVVDHTEDTEPEPEVVEPQATELPDEPPVDTDPLQWIPSEFQDTIDGTVAINRKGFEVLAHHYSISCQTQLIERSDDVVVHKAVAETEDGTLYSAFGEAHSSEDKQTQLVRLSDTRAFKRAVSRATGIGMIAVEELQNEL